MVMTSEAKDLYLSGDVIKYKEKYTEVTQERVCLTTGEWTGSDDMFSGGYYVPFQEHLGMNVKLLTCKQ